MLSRMSGSRFMISVGLVLLLTAILIGFAGFGLAAVVAQETPTQEPPVDTPTGVPPDTPTPAPLPTSTPVPVTEIFIPAPATGGGTILGVPIIFWAAGFGLVLIGLGLAWRRAR